MKTRFKKGDLVKYREKLGKVTNISNRSIRSVSTSSMSCYEIEWILIDKYSKSYQITTFPIAYADKAFDPPSETELILYQKI